MTLDVNFTVKICRTSSVNKNNSNTPFCSEFLAFLKPFSMNCDWTMLNVINTYVNIYIIKCNPVHYVCLSLCLSNRVKMPLNDLSSSWQKPLIFQWDKQSNVDNAMQNIEQCHFKSVTKMSFWCSLALAFHFCCLSHYPVRWPVRECEHCVCIYHNCAKCTVMHVPKWKKRKALWRIELMQQP